MSIEKGSLQEILILVYPTRQFLKKSEMMCFGPHLDLPLFSFLK